MKIYNILVYNKNIIYQNKKKKIRKYKFKHFKIIFQI